MATYASTQQLMQRYPERDMRHMTDPTGEGVDLVRIEQSLQDASGEIDSYLQRRYTLPLIDADGAFVTDSNLLQTLRHSDDVKDARQRYEDAIKWLKQVASGEAAVPGALLRPGIADAAPAQSAGMPAFGSPPSLFGRRHR
jgi:phage gp36-like protein